MYELHSACLETLNINIRTIVSQASGQVKMAIFLVDMEFREKAKQLLTSKEIFAVIFFLVFAMVPWVEVRKSKSQIEIQLFKHFMTGYGFCEECWQLYNENDG